MGMLLEVLQKSIYCNEGTGSAHSSTETKNFSYN